MRLAYGMANHDPDITKKKFAGLLGLAEATYATYETGVSYPHVKTLAKLEDVTGFSLDWLITGKDPEKKETAIPSLTLVASARRRAG